MQCFARYKNMPAEQLAAVKMALSVTDEQIQARDTKDRDTLLQFRQVHEQRMKNGMNTQSPPSAQDVKEQIKKQNDLKAKQKKDPEEELRKMFTFLGTDKKWTTQEAPSSAGDGEARCPTEEKMIEGTRDREYIVSTTKQR
jgi:hypothetical protein